jgi:lysophospholipase L1-like esterase
MAQRRCLATVLLPLVATLAVPTVQAPPFEDEILKFEAEDRVRPPVEGGVLFVGSSSIRLWKSLAQDFPQYQTINRGFGGSAISDSVRNADRIVTPYKPRAVVFFAGTNDLWSRKSPETVLADYRAFVEKVRAKLPDVPIAYIAISPAPSRWSKIKEIRQTNAMVKAYTESTPSLRFVDTYSLMLNAIGGPRPELYVADNLHLSPQGYAIWKDAVGKVLETMVPAGRG